MGDWILLQTRKLPQRLLMTCIALCSPWPIRLRSGTLHYKDVSSLRLIFSL